METLILIRGLSQANNTLTNRVYTDQSRLYSMGGKSSVSSESEPGGLSSMGPNNVGAGGWSDDVVGGGGDGLGGETRGF